MNSRDLSQADLVALGKAIREAEEGAERAVHVATNEANAAIVRANRIASLDKRAESFQRWETTLVEAESLAGRRIEALAVAVEGETPADTDRRRQALSAARRLLDEIHDGGPAFGGGLPGTVRALGIAVEPGAPRFGLTRTRKILAEIEEERAGIAPAVELVQEVA